jgi:hypothetical protein
MENIQNNPTLAALERGYQRGKQIQLAQSAMQAQNVPSQQTTTSGNPNVTGWRKSAPTAWISEALGTTGAVLGGIVGGPAGAAIGAGVLGSLGSALEQTIRDDKVNIGKVAMEGGIDALMAYGPFRLMGKATGIHLTKAAAKEAGVGVAKLAEGGAEGAGKTGIQGWIAKIQGKAAEGLTDKAAASYLQLTPSQTKQLLAQGYKPKELAQLATRFGVNYDDIIGLGGKGGALNETIKAIEGGIQQQAKSAGAGVRFSGDNIIKALQAEKKLLAKSLGNDVKVQALDELIAGAEKKYAKGFTLKQGLDILRAGNSKFGKSVIDVSAKDAVINAAQKIETNAVRAVMKDTIPSIATGLNSQARLITLRDLLINAQAKEVSSKLAVPGITLTQPSTWIQPLLNKKSVQQAILTGGAPQVTGQLAQQAAPAAGRTLGQTLNTPISELTAGLGQKFTKQAVQQQTRRAIPRQIASTYLQQTSGLNAPVQTGTLEDALMQQGYGGIEAGAGAPGPMQEPVGQTPYSRQNMLSDVQRDPRNASKYIDLYNSLAKVYAPTSNQLKLSDTAIKNVNEVQKGLSDISQLYSIISSSQGLVDPILGRIRGANPYDVQAQNVQASIDRIRQVIGKALEGGVLRKEDEIKYKKILPTLTDNKATAIYKIQQLYMALNNDLQNYVGLQQSYGKGATTGTTVEDTLMQLQQLGGY